MLLLNFSLLRFDVLLGLLIGDLGVLPLCENDNQKRENPSHNFHAQSGGGLQLTIQEIT